MRKNGIYFKKYGYNTDCKEKGIELIYGLVISTRVL